MNQQIIETVISALINAFPYPVRVQVSPEDDRVLWVMVFSVPDDMVQPIRDFVYDLEEERFAGAGVVFLPMVKDIGITREYYHEYLLEPSPVPAKKMETIWLSSLDVVSDVWSTSAADFAATWNDCVACSAKTQPSASLDLAINTWFKTRPRASLFATHQAYFDILLTSTKSTRATQNSLCGQPWEFASPKKNEQLAANEEYARAA